MADPTGGIEGAVRGAGLARWPDGGLGRMLQVAFLLRLAAVAVTTVSFLARPPTPLVVLVTLAVAGVSFLGISAEQRLVGLCQRHPFVVLADVFATMAVVGVVGVQNPLVFATLTTAFIVGLIFTMRTGAVVIVGMVAMYLLAVAQGRDRVDFVAAAVVPLLYATLFAIGDAYRRVTAEQVRSWRQLLRERADRSSADERARLAREMHDSLAKTLHGIAMGATALPDWVRRDPERAVTYARALADGAEQAAAEARAILVRMRADQPDRPLAQILGTLCEEWAAENGVHCAFEAVGVADVSHDVRYQLVTIAAEALENVHRHADASQVAVRLRLEDGDVVLEVVDNGVGFDTAQPRPPGHFGLQGMAERAREVGGRVELVSAPGEGTTVRVVAAPHGAAVGADSWTEGERVG